MANDAIPLAKFGQDVPVMVKRVARFWRVGVFTAPVKRYRYGRSSDSLTP